MLKNLKNKLKDNKGFSLVELIVVIAIMVILIALLIPSVSGYIKKANDTASKTAARSVYDAAVQLQADMAAEGRQISGDFTLDDSFPVGENGAEVAFKTEYLQNIKDGAEATITVDGTKGTITKVTYKASSDGAEFTYPEDEADE